MDEKPEKTENFRLWWPASLVTCLMLGVCIGLREYAHSYIQVMFLMLAIVASGNALAHDKVRQIFLWPAAVAAMIIGSYVGGWLIHLFK